MRKSGFFVKIYLWFWLATALIVAAQIGLDRLIVQSPYPPAHYLRKTLDTVLTVYGHVALDYHVRGNHTEAMKLAGALKSSSGIALYFIDRTGEDLGRQSVPTDVLSAAQQVQESGKAKFIFSSEKALLARSLLAENGNSYTIIAHVQRDIFGSHKSITIHGPPGPLSDRKPVFLEAFGPPPPPPEHNPFFLVTRILIMLFLSGGVCYWLARYLTSPVVTLREATRRFAGGDLTVRIGKGIGTRKDELSRLAEDFDHMAGRISSLMAQQRQLLRDISHELRSPLTRLNVAVELARRQTGDDAKPILDRIEAEAYILNEMIGQVLTISRLDSKTEGIPMTPVDLNEMVTEITADADFEAQSRNCNVEFVEGIECTVPGNEELLRRAIENVVRNAVVYTNKNTKVEVRLRRTEHNSIPFAEVSVRDHGPGVPESKMPNLFQPFYRVSNARERKTGGTGLGLTIAKRAVSLHNGTITLSNAQDGGLIVVILLPLLRG